MRIKKAIESANTSLPANITEGPAAKVTYCFDAAFEQLVNLVPATKVIIVTDTNVFRHHQSLFSNWPVIVIPAGEEHKQQATVDFIISKMIELEADRNSFLVGVGGGVVTDIAGFAAGVFMRGIRFGFVPTSILAMVDASIGGKNGIDTGIYKNLVGLIRQPEFLLYDYSLLQTLPEAEWINGFAEIIKHGCILDRGLFTLLESQSLEYFMQDKQALSVLIERNVDIKTRVVLKDEFEKADRKLLNFGHTIGHAIENQYQLPHGHAVAIGMVAAAAFSTQLTGLAVEEKERLVRLLEKYCLPVTLPENRQQIADTISMDKKKAGDSISFILLKSIGDSSIHPIALPILKQMILGVN